MPTELSFSPSPYILEHLTMKTKEPYVIEGSLFAGKRAAEVPRQSLGDIGGLDLIQLAAVNDILDLQFGDIGEGCFAWDGLEERHCLTHSCFRGLARISLAAISTSWSM